MTQILESCGDINTQQIFGDVNVETVKYVKRTKHHRPISICKCNKKTKPSGIEGIMQCHFVGGLDKYGISLEKRLKVFKQVTNIQVTNIQDVKMYLLRLFKTKGWKGLKTIVNGYKKQIKIYRKPRNGVKKDKKRRECDFGGNNTDKLVQRESVKEKRSETADRNRNGYKDRGRDRDRHRSRDRNRDRNRSDSSEYYSDGDRAYHRYNTSIGTSESDRCDIDSDNERETASDRERRSRSRSYSKYRDRETGYRIHRNDRKYIDSDNERKTTSYPYTYQGRRHSHRARQSRTRSFSRDRDTARGHRMHKSDRGDVDSDNERETVSYPWEYKNKVRGSTSRSYWGDRERGYRTYKGDIDSHKERRNRRTDHGKYDDEYRYRH